MYPPPFPLRPLYTTPKFRYCNSYMAILVLNEGSLGVEVRLIFLPIKNSLKLKFFLKNYMFSVACESITINNPFFADNFVYFNLNIDKFLVRLIFTET